MIKILFICHGNICRSPMAEFIMKDLAQKRGVADRFYIASAATSREEIGNPVYPPAKKLLASKGISCEGKTAIQMTSQDYNTYDYIIGAEEANVRNILRIIQSDPEKKVHRLLDFSQNPRDISDPWYTGDFETTYDDVLEGCTALLEHILSSQNPASNADSSIKSVQDSSSSLQEDPQIEEDPDLLSRYLDFKMGKGVCSEKEKKLFQDYEAVKKHELTLDDIDEWTMVQIYQLLYQEMNWISENRKNGGN